MSYPGSWVYLAASNDELAGFVLGNPSSSEETIISNEKDEYLALLMIDPKRWGKGIGGTLLDAAADKARTLGRERLILWTGRDNIRARLLYSRKGYNLTNKLWRSRRQPEGVLEQFGLELGE